MSSASLSGSYRFTSSAETVIGIRLVRADTAAATISGLGR